MFTTFKLELKVVLRGLMIAVHVALILMSSQLKPVFALSKRSKSFIILCLTFTNVK